jgi:dTDP-4-dehydrorhamnose 3,5-epimerase
MRFIPAPLEGAFVVDIEPRGDDRGFFGRAFCAREFERHGLNAKIAQINISTNSRSGTIRGLHYQIAPALEAKFMRCIRGAIFDVMVDMRPESPTYFHWFGAELTADNNRAVFTPEMFAHGYQALSDDCVVIYSASEFYAPECERGIRYDDPAIGIRWPLPATDLSLKDQSWPLVMRNKAAAS